MQYTKSFSELMTGLGVLAAGIYFGWRLYRGYFVQNLSLDLQVTRFPKAGTHDDYLAVQTKVTKGDRNTTTFCDMKVQLKWLENRPSRIEAVETIKRFAFGQQELENPANRNNPKILDRKRKHLVKVYFDEQHPTTPFLNMTPGETTQFSHLTTVPKNDPCVVDVVLIGRVKKSDLYGQWRASAVSVPLPEKATPQLPDLASLLLWS
jgi:hypothetical protein